MAKLSPNTVTILDGDVRLTRRGGSSAWQAAFKIGDRWVRTTTKFKQLADARERAKELYMEYRFKAKHDLPIVTKRFDAVANLVVADLRKQLDAGVGKKVFRDYITAIETYLIPFFGTKHVNNISFTELKEFAVWRAAKMRREPKASTITTHNTALNRVFDEAVNRNFMSKNKIPNLVNTGDDGERRPDFGIDDYRAMVRKLPNWAKDEAVHTQKSRDMRMLLWDYVIVLANSGLRHGTEAENLRWRQVHVWEEKGRVYLELQGVSGKTKAHNVMCRPSALAALRRIHARTKAIAEIDFEVMLKQRLDLPVFALPDGTVSKNLNQTFRRFLDETGLLKCPVSQQNRTLYSLRHTYATFALINDGMDIHVLARNMGTSISMIELHYNHLQPRMKKDMLSGPDYGLTREEYLAQKTLDDQDGGD
jgi:integrase